MSHIHFALQQLLTFITIFILILSVSPAFSQFGAPENDKCGYDEQLAKISLLTLGDHWGYGYDSLLNDLSQWVASPYVSIDSIGASVQNRALWQLTITSPDTGIEERQTVFIHARTHPGEIQSWWVTEQIINILLSEDDIAELLRKNCVFYILPMYNPDGVELEYIRENANGIDIESNWANNPLEPEVEVLRKRFTDLMNSESAIKIALNMHSAYRCLRYFVYHDQVGTSLSFAASEKTFIEGIRYYFPSGIQPWNYYISWTNGTPTYYPESWFWLNFQEAVMALTYEDMNCDQAGEFNHTAIAILQGIADYLNIISAAIKEPIAPLARNFQLYQTYPNPFNPQTKIHYTLSEKSQVQLNVYDLTGRKVAQLVNRVQDLGNYYLNYKAGQLSSGIYLLELKVNNQQIARKMILRR